MGAVNCIIVNERAIVWTDGGQYDASGRLIAIAPNCINVSDRPLVVVARAFPPALFGWRDHLIKTGADVDLLLAKGEHLFGSYLEQEGMTPSELDGTFWCIGWSKANNSAVIVEIDAEKFAGKRLRIVKSVMTPAVAQDERSAIEVVLAMAASPSAVDFVAFGTALLTTQRQIPVGREADGSNRYRVGGYVLQTDISHLGVNHEIIHTWADTIGERTDPFRLSGF